MTLLWICAGRLNQCGTQGVQSATCKLWATRARYLSLPSFVVQVPHGLSVFVALNTRGTAVRLSRINAGKIMSRGPVAVTSVGCAAAAAAAAPRFRNSCTFFKSGWSGSVWKSGNKLMVDKHENRSGEEGAKLDKRKSRRKYDFLTTLLPVKRAIFIRDVHLAE